MTLQNGQTDRKELFKMGQQNMADIILISNAIFTSNDEEPFQGAIAIKDQTIIDIGTIDDMKRYQGEETKVYEYGDNLIVPGFNDFHIHLFIGSLWADSVSLSDATSEDEAAQMVKRFADSRPDDEWIFGFNWYHIYWDEKQLPHRKALDKYIPDRPVFLFNDELHGAWVNTKALELMGIDENTPDPPFGEIARDENGVPTGFLYETAMGFAQKVFDNIPKKQQEKLLNNFLRYAAQLGVTSVSDMLPLPNLQLGNLALYKEYEESGKLSVRINFLAELDGDLEKAIALREQYRSDKLRLSGLKQFLDGVFITYTAFLVEPYADNEETRGNTLIPADKVKEWVIEADKENFRVRLHACGDAAVRLGLDCFEEAEKQNGKRDARHTIEHIELIHPDDLDRFEKLGVIASIQPDHMAFDKESHNAYPDRVGKSREHLTFPNKLLKDHGATVVLGSDFPVVDMNPMHEIYRALTRVHNDGKPEGGWNPKEKISLADAIVHYTKDAAFGTFMEDKLGTLEKGKLADIVVLDRNLFNVPAEEIKEAKPVLTIMDGKVVYEKEN